ncbi:MAG: sigma-70 family RNA polymerase sigma factor [Patescibacteria group bacterium]
MDHRELIKKAKEGDRPAFDELYRTVYAPVYRFIVMRVKSKDEAEDLCQIVFTKFFIALPSYRDSGPSVLPYLFTMARNAIIDETRKRKPIYDDDALWSIADQSPSAEQNSMQHEEVMTVLNAMQACSEAEEAVLKLRYLDGFSTAEVAALLEKSPEAIRQLLSRALRHIRTYLRGTTRSYE